MRRLQGHGCKAQQDGKCGQTGQTGETQQVQNNGLCVRTRQWYGQGKGNGGNSPATVKEL